MRVKQWASDQVWKERQHSDLNISERMLHTLSSGDSRGAPHGLAILGNEKSAQSFLA